MTSDRPLALITGTSRGIGNHLARHFLANGYAVVGCSRSRPEDLSDPHYVHHLVDVGSEPDVVELFRVVRRDYGHLEVAINNAISDTRPSLGTLTTGIAVEDMLRTNVLGVFLVCREAIKLMMRRGHGRIVNIGSMTTRHQNPGEAMYSASKAAVNAMTRSLAKESAQYGITCNVLAPAAVESDSLAAMDPDAVRAMLERNAFKEVGSVDQISDTLDWLVSPEASAITGQLIYLGGV